MISRRFDDHAPLASWFVFSAYDAAHECEGAKFLNREGHKQSGDPMKAAMDSAQCIATDDPRLKESRMNPRHATACARCGKVGKQRQLNELLEFDKDEPIVAICNHCLHLLRYTDARTWKWFREYRDRLISNRDK
jgi:hypothetical protein